MADIATAMKMSNGYLRSTNIGEKVSTSNNNSVFYKAIRLCIIIALCTSLNACSNSDNSELFATLKGCITDYSTGQPLPNATVTLSPSGLSKQTDSSGLYAFEGIDSKQYTLIVQKSGYQPNRKTVIAVSGESLTVDF